MVLIDNMSSISQITAWRRPGDKPLPEPMLTRGKSELMKKAGPLLNIAFPGMKISMLKIRLSRDRLIFNTLRPWQNGRHLADDIFKCIFLNRNVRISIKISLKFVPKDLVNNTPALVQIMAWRRPGDKPLSEPMMVSLLTHICVTRSQWVNMGTLYQQGGIFILRWTPGNEGKLITLWDFPRVNYLNS